MAATVAGVDLLAEDSSPPFTVTKPAGFASGDGLVVVHVADGGVLADLTAAAGWVLQGSFSLGNLFGKVWSRAFAGGEPATWDFGYNAGSDTALIMTRVSGFDSSNTVVVTSTTMTSTSSMDSPTVTPTGADDLLLCFLANLCSGTALGVTKPASMTSQGQAQVAGNFMALAAASEQLASSAPTGVRTWTSVTPTGITAATVSVAIKSAAAGGAAADTGWQPPQLPPYLLYQLIAQAQRLSGDTPPPDQASASTPEPLVSQPPFAWPAAQPALVFAAPAQPVGVQPLLVTPPQAWPQVPAPLITASQPLGNPAVGTPGPLVVSTPWKAPVPGAAITSNPAAPVVSTATTPGPLVVTPPYVPAPVPAVTVTASQPLGNPAVPSPGPLVVGPPYTQVPVPGARMSGNPAAPVGSTGATPGPLVAGPATTPVLIPRTVLSSSFPLGNPATATPPPLVVGPPFTLAPVPGAKVFAAPAAPTVPAVGTPGPLVVTPPFRPVPIPRTYFSASFPLGNPATPTPQPLLVSPAHRWAQLTPATMFTAAGCACTVTRPATGTVTRPSAGTVAYGGATVVRPSTGVVTRPNTGIVEDPCC